MGKRPAAFVDRDDTIIADVKYCSDPEKVQLLRGAPEGLRLLAEAGYIIVIVTNQSGIGRGYFDEQKLEAVHLRMKEKLRTMGSDFDAVYYCPHRPEDNCPCRKPRPGLLLRAASELNLDLDSSYTIGDSEWDVEAGRTAGTKTVLVRKGVATGMWPLQPRSSADIVAETLQEAAQMILEQN